MEFSNRPEFDAGGLYIAPPGEEQTMPGPEFTPPGLEIQPPGEEFPPDEKHYPESPPRKHSKRLIAAFLVLLGLFAAGRDNAPPSAAPLTSVPTETETILSTEPGHAAEPATEATAPPAFYPIHLRVYGGYLVNDGEAVLLDADLDPGTVSELSIPQPEPQPGYRFLGYALVHRDRTATWLSRTVLDSLDLPSLHSCKPDANNPLGHLDCGRRRAQLSAADPGRQRRRRHADLRCCLSPTVRHECLPVSLPRSCPSGVAVYRLVSGTNRR